MKLADAPIQRKLMLVVLLSTVIAMVLKRGAFFAYEYITFRQTTLRQLTTLGGIVAANSTAALAFQNQDDAQEVLSALRADPHIVAASLYDRAGRLFATYPEALVLADLPAGPGADGYKFADGHLAGFQPVIQRGRPLGTLYLRYETRTITNAWLLLSLGIALAVIAVVLALTYFFSRRLQHQISRPILALAETARAISERHDYSVRATRLGGHEIGLLTDAFNRMLTQIHEQTQSLGASQQKLQTQLSRLDLLSRTTHAIGERQDLPSIFQVVIRSLEDNLPVDFGCVCLYDEPSQTLTVTSLGARSGPVAATIALGENARIPADRNGLARCVQGHLVYEADISGVEFPFPQRLARGGLRAFVASPMMADDKVFGVLIVARTQPHSFSSADCEFLLQLSTHVALASRQAQLHSELKQAYDELRQSQHAVLQQERLRVLGQMASGIAHDINNAISPVALYTESLLEREPNLSPRARDQLTTIQRAIDDVAQTVARMREFYRPREPQLVLERIAPNQIVQQVVTLTRVRWNDVPQERGIFIALQTELAEDLPPIMGAEFEIRDALTNLIFNAIDAMPEGGKITVRTRAVPGRHPDDGTSVHIEISDTGIGMDEETRRRCLEPFFTTKGERGTGLGLAMVYGMVQRHSAGIEIDSAPGRGTTMRIIFAAATQAGEPAVRLPAPGRPSAALRVLVVDDDPMLIKSLQETLSDDGHQVTTADGGQAGLEAFRAAQERGEPFAIVITDLGMPYVDGRKVAAGVKGLSSVTPVIMLTGWGQRMLAENEIPPHVDRVLSKPPKLHELRTALAQLSAAPSPVR